MCADCIVQVSYYYKVFIAAMAARAQQAYETSLLEEAERLSNTPLYKFVEDSLAAEVENATLAAFQYQRLVNATCACDSVWADQYNLTTWGSRIYESLNTTVDYFNTSLLANNTVTSVLQYQTSYCTRLAGGELDEERRLVVA